MTINLKGELIDLLQPKIMGILNLTPDSFYDGGQFNVLDRALEQTEKMIYEGAFFIDLGLVAPNPEQKKSVRMRRKKDSTLYWKNLLKISKTTFFHRYISILCCSRKS